MAWACCPPLNVALLNFNWSSKESKGWQDTENTEPDAEPVFHECEPDPPAVLREPLVVKPKRSFWRFPCRCARRQSAARAQSSSSTQELQQTEKLSSRDADGAICPSIDNLSQTKRQKIAELQARLDALPANEQVPKRHDHWLKRFLAHGSWDVDKAMQLYVEMEAWRREAGADRALAEDPTGALNPVIPIDAIGFYPYSFDLQGRMIVWMRVGHTPWWRSLIELTDQANAANMWLSEAFLAEVGRKAKLDGVWRERAVVLIDLSDMDWNYFQGMASSSRARRRGTLHTCSQYYPGLVDKAYIINAPGFANRAWSILKMFLSKALMEKAEIVSTDTEVAAMMTDLGAENVPRALGGQSTTSSSYLPEHLMMPEEGWTAKLQAWLPREITIPAHDIHEELVEVPSGKSVSWRWTLTDSVVGFEVARRSSTDAEFETMVPKKELTFSSEEEPDCGSVDAPEGGGEIRFLWDNTGSRLRTRTLLLRLEVL